MDWKTILAYVTGSVDDELLRRNEYLVAENRILRAQIKGRLTDGERYTLARMRVVQEAQLLIPLRFEGVGHESVVGIDPHEAEPREVHLVLRPLDVCPPERVGLVQPGLEFSLDAEGDLEGYGIDRVDDEGADRGVDAHARDLLAAGLTGGDAGPLAHRDGDDGLIGRMVVAHGHPQTARPADDEPLKQRRSCAGRTPPPILPLHRGILAEHRLVVFKLVQVM